MKKITIAEIKERENRDFRKFGSPCIIFETGYIWYMLVGEYNYCDDNNHGHTDRIAVLELGDFGLTQMILYTRKDNNIAWYNTIQEVYADWGGNHWYYFADKRDVYKHFGVRASLEKMSNVFSIIHDVDDVIDDDGDFPPPPPTVCHVF